MFCSKCGAKIEQDTNFCQECGAKVESTDINDENLSSKSYDEENLAGNINENTKANLKTRLKNVLFSSDKKFYLLFAAVFIMQMMFLPKSIILFITKKPLPSITTPVLSIIMLVLFTVFLTRYLKDDKTKSGLKDMALKAVNIIIAFSFIVTVFSAFSLLGRYGYERILKAGMDKGVEFFGLILAAAVLVLLVQILAAAGIMLLGITLKYDIRTKHMGSAFFEVLKQIFKKSVFMVIMAVIGSGVIILSAFLLNIIANAASYCIPYAFLAYFINSLAGALLGAYLIYIYCNVVKYEFDNNKIISKLKSKNKSKKIPVFGALCLVLAVVSVFLLKPAPLNAIDMIKQDIMYHVNSGDALLEIGMSTGAVREYDIAYSKFLAYKGFLKAVKGYKDDDTALQNEGYELLKQAAAADPKNAYAAYFKGRLKLKFGTETDSINLYEEALKYPDTPQELYLDLLYAYSKNNDKENSLKMWDTLVENDLYNDRFSSIEKAGSKKLDDYIIKLDKLEEGIELKNIYKIIERTKYYDHAYAVTELEKLFNKYPENPEISYYLAEVFDEYRSDSSRYSNVIKYTDLFADNYKSSGNREEEIGVELYRAEMYVRTGNEEDALKVLDKLYVKYGYDEDICMKYAYVLNMNKNYDKSINIINEVLEKNPDNIFAGYILAMDYLNKKQYTESVNEMVRIINIIDKNETSPIEYEDYLYGYTLAYSNTMNDANAADAVENISTNKLLYNYIYGITEWSKGNSDSSIEYLNKVLDENNYLGYVLYTIGVNYYEKAVRSGDGNFKLAEEKYLESLELLPEHAEGYFALAHCYKKWGKNVEALRAFRKVVDLLPYEDHRIDPYGMTVHAIGEIRNLSKYEEVED